MPVTQVGNACPAGVCPQICSELSTCQLSYRAREIFSKFLCSKATTPVNIDSQAQLADDILNAPHPDMFKEQQLQVTLRAVYGASSQGLGFRALSEQRALS